MSFTYFFAELYVLYYYVLLNYSIWYLLTTNSTTDNEWNVVLNNPSIYNKHIYYSLIAIDTNHQSPKLMHMFTTWSLEDKMVWLEQNIAPEYVRGLSIILHNLIARVFMFQVNWITLIVCHVVAKMCSTPSTWRTSGSKIYK